MRAHPPAGRLAAGVDDLWPEPFGKPRSRDLTVMGSKAEPATALKSAAERRSSPAPPRRQFGHVTSFLKGWAATGKSAGRRIVGRVGRSHPGNGDVTRCVERASRAYRCERTYL